MMPKFSAEEQFLALGSFVVIGRGINFPPLLFCVSLRTPIFFDDAFFHLRLQIQFCRDETMLTTRSSPYQPFRGSVKPGQLPPHFIGLPQLPQEGQELNAI